jgi:hypothetical protein
MVNGNLRLSLFVLWLGGLSIDVRARQFLPIQRIIRERMLGFGIGMRPNIGVVYLNELLILMLGYTFALSVAHVNGDNVSER